MHETALQQLGPAPRTGGRESTVARYERGAHAALSGRYHEARTLLIEVWETEAPEEQLASAAAWLMAVLMLEERNYSAAAEWFTRVGAWPEGMAALWPLARRLITQHCTLLEQTPQLAMAREQQVTQQEPRLPGLRITHLGRFEISRGGEQLASAKSRKAMALLRYLLTRKQYTAHKDELTETLWPGAGAHAGLHCLHVTVAALRHYLDPPGELSYVVFDSGYYALAPEATIVDDANVFRQLTRRAEQLWRSGDYLGAQGLYQEAIAGYQGDYCVEERDTTWALVEREQLAVHYLLALEHLGKAYVREERWEAAVEIYQRLLQRDGFREDIHYAVMRCYLELGRRQEALQQYERCRAQLEDELGLEPTHDLQALYDTVRRSPSKLDST